MRPLTKNLVSAGFVLAALLSAWVVVRRSSSVDTSSNAPATPSSDAADSASPGAGAPAATPTGAVATSAAITAGDAGISARLRATWGSSPGELGHVRPQEGNAEGPMSFALAGDDLVVVDQVNGRLVRYGPDGKVKGTTPIAATVQDVAVAKDGKMLLLDRLGEKAITLTDASGRAIGRLPLDKERVGETGNITGVFADGKDVWVEKEHGILVRVGSVDGEPAEGHDELAGRPSKDGTLLLTATIASKAGGRVAVNAVDRNTAALRFARALTFPRPLEGLVLLDTDDKGTIYVGAAGGGAGRATVACLDGADGHALGFVTVPHSTSVDESFRDFTVAGDGTIVVALRTEQGVEYLSVRCP